MDLGGFKIRVGVISHFFDVYTGTTKFKSYIKTFEISVVFAVRNIKLYILKSLLQKMKSFNDLN